MPSFSNTLEQAIHAALALANDHRHELATLEHLLLALTDEPDAVKVMRACNVDLDELRRMLTDYIDDDLSTLVTDGTMLKVYAWYDNEMGYACRMVDLARHLETVGI